MVYGNNAKDIALFSSNFNKIHDNNLDAGYIIFPRASSEEIYGRCIDLSASKYNDIYNNTIINATYAIYLGEIEEASQYNNIYQNTIYNSINGIYLAYSPQNYVYSNRIQNCSVGINLSATNNAVNVQNDITECKLAVSIMGSNNQFYHNNIINNTNQVSIVDQMLFSSSIVYASSVNNTFDNGYPAGGNYWSSFQGTDSNSDGISETPYIINSNSSDRYPFMHPVSFIDYTPPTKPAITYDPTPTPTAPPATEAPTTNPTQTPALTLQPIETTKPKETPTLIPTVTANPEAPELQTLIILPALAGLTLLLVAVGLKKHQGVPPKNP
jgi:parallel beta-helix repeat protein